jgi:CRISPR-associated protein Cmr2
MDAEELQVWQAKLAAWLHDPAEKALILMRTPDGHEAGTVARLRELCFGGEVLTPELDRLCRLADHWAAAADRPQWPRPKDDKHMGGDVRFWDRSKAVLVHPLGGDQYNLDDLYIDKAGRIEAESSQHYEGVLRGIDLGEEFGKHETGTEDLVRRALFTLWRLAPARAPKGLGLGEVWRLLPADSRVPDHSIWEHLSLASAFAGAVSGDVQGNPALLLVSLGPVQGFIEQSRSVSDLWAGSHLLSMMSWQAMKVVAERFGPDSVIFPSLWGVPLVDVWLEREMGVVLPDDLDWKTSRSDANPLFSPCLPNRFVAIVPAAAAATLATDVKKAVRDWLNQQAHAAARRVLKEAGAPGDAGAFSKQIERQLLGFPEVHWSSVPFRPLIEWNSKGQLTSVDGLCQALREFIGGVEKPGFFSHPLWALIGPHVGENGGELRIEAYGADDPVVYAPNPGAVYPALSDVLDRAHAAAKAIRAFGQVREEGYRCDLCGEWEWLRAPDEQEHRKPRGSRGQTIWSALAEGHESWVRQGEHLCARCALKRLWPTLFVEWVRDNVERLKEDGVARHVVSTHTMALAPDLAKLPPTKAVNESDESYKRRMNAWNGLRAALTNVRGVPLPRKLVHELVRRPEAMEFARKLPALLDILGEDDDDEARKDAEAPGNRLASVRKQLRTLLGHAPEAYYGLVLMDGDGMGKWMSGEPDVMLSYRDTWHPSLLENLEKRFRHADTLQNLLEAPREASPSHHAAVSTSLNGFSLHVARWVVEELFYGRLIYAGGDDVLAMVAVDDLLPCMLILRCAYSGILPAGEREAIWELYKDVKDRLTWIDKGYVLLGGKQGRLLRMMGGRATASAGAVVAHHAAPLQAVLRRLRQAEKAAKTYGRNAFSIALMKRAGGETTYTASWGFGGIPKSGKTANMESCLEPRDIPYEPQQWATTTSGLRTPMGVLFELRNTLAGRDVSRRAAYQILSWLGDIPSAPGEQLNEAELADLLASSIAYQLGRQGVKPDKAEPLASAMVKVAIRQCRPNASGGKWAPVTDHLKHMITVAEFLAREGRTGPGRAPATDEPANQGGGA